MMAVHLARVNRVAPRRFSQSRAVSRIAFVRCIARCARIRSSAEVEGDLVDLEGGSVKRAWPEEQRDAADQDQNDREAQDWTEDARWRRRRAAMHVRGGAEVVVDHAPGRAGELDEDGWHQDQADRDVEAQHARGTEHDAHQLRGQQDQYDDSGGAGEAGVGLHA
jgi:hypothetical protein